MVQFPAGFDFSTLTNLTVTVAIVDPNDANLGLTLIAPSGDSLTLVLAQVTTVGGTANTGIGISGANLGTITYTMNNIATYAIGTTFDDNATRSIFDPNTGGTNANTAPYIGNYRIEGGFGGRQRPAGVPPAGNRQGDQRHLEAGDHRNGDQRPDQPRSSSTSGR